MSAGANGGKEGAAMEYYLWYIKTATDLIPWQKGMTELTADTTSGGRKFFDKKPETIVVSKGKSVPLAGGKAEPICFSYGTATDFSHY